jgi:hypothetical protein
MSYNPFKIGKIHSLPEKLSNLRQRLNQKAKQSPGYKFYSLYGHLFRRDVLETAWEHVSKNSGETPGIDGITVKDIETGEGGANKFLSDLQTELKGYFDSIPHDKLLKCVKMRVADRSVLKLIRLWLKAPVIEHDSDGHTKVQRPDKGTPQGGVISPLLANIYLKMYPSKKALQAEKRRIRMMTSKKWRWVPANEIIVTINKNLIGWSNYFKKGYSSKEFRWINHFVRSRLYKFLSNKSQRAYRVPIDKSVYKHLSDLGLISL